VNGGHNTPFLCSPSPHTASPKLATLDLTGIPLGIDDARLYSQKTTQLEPGEFIIFYTDGVIDALNENQEAFGLRRLTDAINNFCNLSAAEIVAGLESALQTFIDGNDPFDDITIVVVKRLQANHL
jgi:sigma-B regulation protein RsbU (phosphoserine phosphatase)